MSGLVVGALVAFRQSIKKAVIEDGRQVKWLCIAEGDVGRIAWVEKAKKMAGKSAKYIVLFHGNPIEVLGSHIELVDGAKVDEIADGVLKVADPDLVMDSETDDAEKDDY